MRIGKALTAALLAIAPLSATAQEPAGEPAQVLLTPEQAGQIDAAGETVAYQVSAHYAALCAALSSNGCSFEKPFQLHKSALEHIR